MCYQRDRVAATTPFSSCRVIVAEENRHRQPFGSDATISVEDMNVINLN
jgi:hypothetical protein